MEETQNEPATADPVKNRRNYVQRKIDTIDRGFGFGWV
jgi:hypothetical protein